jgi:hypothetical protein
MRVLQKQVSPQMNKKRERRAQYQWNKPAWPIFTLGLEGSCPDKRKANNGVDLQFIHVS